MKHYPCVLTIAGSDCSGGAGIQADIKTISALGTYAASAITAITVQNTCGVTGIHPVPPSYVKGQIEAVMTDIRHNSFYLSLYVAGRYRMNTCYSTSILYCDCCNGTGSISSQC